MHLANGVWPQRLPFAACITSTAPFKLAVVLGENRRTQTSKGQAGELVGHDVETHQSAVAVDGCAFEAEAIEPVIQIAPKRDVIARAPGAFPPV